MSKVKLTVVKQGDLSASGMQRVERCPGYRHLPWTMNASLGAERGTEFDQFVDDAIQHGFEAAFSRLKGDEAKALARGFNFRQLFDILETEEPKSQLAVAYNVETDKGKILGHHLNRKYGVKFPWIPGSLDFIGIHPTHAVIVDIKTGLSYVPPPVQNWQLKTQALAVSRAFGIYDIHTYIVKCIDDGDMIVPAPARYDFMQLDMIAADMRKMLSRNEIVAGDHCKWCPALAYCPVQSKVAQALIDQTKRDDILTPEVAEELYKKVKAVKSALDKVEPLLKEYVASQGPIQMSDGRYLHVNVVEQEKFKPDVAYEVVKEICGHQVAEKISTLSKSAIYREVDKTTYGKIMRAVKAREGIVVKDRRTLEAVSEDKIRKAQG